MRHRESWLVLLSLNHVTWVCMEWLNAKRRCENYTTHFPRTPKPSVSQWGCSFQHGQKYLQIFAIEILTRHLLTYSIHPLHSVWQVLCKRLTHIRHLESIFLGSVHMQHDVLLLWWSFWLMVVRSTIALSLHLFFPSSPWLNNHLMPLCSVCPLSTLPLSPYSSFSTAHRSPRVRRPSALNWRIRERWSRQLPACPRFGPETDRGAQCGQGRRAGGPGAIRRRPRD